MATRSRKLQVLESESVLGFYCTACKWSESIISGKPGELSEEEVRAAFDRHVCTGREDVNQAAARLVREATKD